jgi:hypothetical protein
MRNSMRRPTDTPALRSMRPFCTSIAQRTASTTLRSIDRCVGLAAVQAFDPHLRQRAGCSRRHQTCRREDDWAAVSK